MKPSNVILFIEWMRNDDLCETEEEKCLLRGALIAALKWGEKIDAENEAQRAERNKRGVTFKTFPAD